MAKYYYCLGIAPYTKILNSLIFDNKKDATERAKQENKQGEFKGRGVKVYKCNEYGNLIK